MELAFLLHCVRVRLYPSTVKTTVSPKKAVLVSPASKMNRPGRSHRHLLALLVLAATAALLYRDSSAGAFFGDNGRITALAPPLKAPPARVAVMLRATDAGRASYLALYRAHAIGGWMDASALALIAALSRAQLDQGMRGAVGEIGVHEGLSFIAAALSADVSEQLFVCDVFEQQDLNVDKSGRGDLAIFESNLGKCGLTIRDVTLSVGSSTSIPRDYFLLQGIKPFRYFSIDGGHTHETTASDLRLAARVLMPGGVVALDDIKNDGWPGVRSALFEFLASKAEPALAPFAMNYKVFMTTPSHHAMMLNITISTLERAGIGGDAVSLVPAGGPFVWPVLRINTDFAEALEVFEGVISEAWRQ